MATLRLKIFTAEREVYEANVDQVTIPSGEGEITVLANHIPLVSTIATGEIRAKHNGVVTPFAVSGGIIEVKEGSEVVILAQYSDSPDEIDVEAEQKAYERAKEAMSRKASQLDVDFAKFELEMRRAMNNIKVARKWYEEN